jgi:aspartate/methionine/tyrosine aminotransferase
MTALINQLQQSPTVALMDQVKAIQDSGRKIFSMQSGDPDFSTHHSIINAAHKAMLDGKTHYSESKGYSQLRKAIIDDVHQKIKIPLNPDKNILITHGAVQGISLAMKLMLKPGDECLIFEPFWNAYLANTIISGASVKVITTYKENGFQLDLEEIASNISQKTKLIVINSPNNPTGAIYSKDSLLALGELCLKQGIYMLLDDVYEEIIHDENKCFALQSEKKFFDNIIKVSSFSKSHAMTGWRVGYVIASEKIISNLLKLSQFSTTCLSLPMQEGALAALQNKDAIFYKNSMLHTYSLRRDLVHELASSSWLQDRLILPQGSFYCLIDISDLKVTSTKLAQDILAKSSVALTPGIAFGENFDNYLRLSFSVSDDDIYSALELLKNFSPD